ncbi:MAG TPA: hypothetical protein VH352_07310 [Pseudonocardiaceae bacterium]|nr:hypothetical protein [Pseudonocardiaceae bacterium]
MSTLDELWTWISTPLHELTAARTDDRDKSWDDLRAYFVERAGLAEPSDHPVVNDMIYQLDQLSDSDRDALLGDGDKLDGFGYEIAQLYADAEAADDSGTAEIRTLLADDPEFADLPAEQQSQTLALIREALGG